MTSMSFVYSWHIVNWRKRSFYRHLSPLKIVTIVGILLCICIKYYIKTYIRWNSSCIQPLDIFLWHCLLCISIVSKRFRIQNGYVCMYCENRNISIKWLHLYLDISFMTCENTFQVFLFRFAFDRDERMHGIASVCREQDSALNLKLFEKMLLQDSSADGYCLRGKIDMQAKNKTLRDPVFFRANVRNLRKTKTYYLTIIRFCFLTISKNLFSNRNVSRWKRRLCCLSVCMIVCIRINLKYH